MSAIAASLDPSTLLRRVLWADATTCLATGALLALAATPLAGLLGLPAALLAYAGGALFPIAGFMTWLAVRDDLSRAGAWVVILGNLGWVLGSVLVLLVLSPSALGHAFVIAQAVVVGLLAELEYLSLRRIAS